MAQIEIIGVYPIYLTSNFVTQSVQYYRYYWLLNEQGTYKYELNQDLFQNLILIEIQAQGNFKKPIVEFIHQSDQVPYLEFYLNIDGNLALKEDEVTKLLQYRLCFFLHFADYESPIEIYNRKYFLKPISELPFRLKPFVHYIPSD